MQSEWLVGVRYSFAQSVFFSLPSPTNKNNTSRAFEVPAASSTFSRFCFSPMSVYRTRSALVDVMVFRKVPSDLREKSSSNLPKEAERKLRFLYTLASKIWDNCSEMTSILSERVKEISQGSRAILIAKGFP